MKYQAAKDSHSSVGLRQRGHLKMTCYRIVALQWYRCISCNCSMLSLLLRLLLLLPLLLLPSSFAYRHRMPSTRGSIAMSNATLLVRQRHASSTICMVRSLTSGPMGHRTSNQNPRAASPCWLWHIDVTLA